jgi:hypothetical protein
LLYLGLQQRKAAEHKTPMWMLVIAGISLLVSLAVATRTTLSLAGAF